jgi:carboxymethylenebutenolidase
MKHTCISASSGAVLLAFVICAPFAGAQDWAKERLNKSPRHGEWVDLKSGERTIKAFVVYPERKEKTAAVLVIHEIFGLTDWARGVCDQLAENGVIAIAPDLLSGQTFEDVDGARKAISALPEDQIKSDLNAAADYALKFAAGNGTLAVCGFCWGGGWTFKYAAMNPKLKAAYSFYGTALDKAKELMKAAGKKYEPVIYKGAGHGFMRSGDPNNPEVREGDKKAREDAWARWKKLLNQLK